MAWGELPIESLQPGVMNEYRYLFGLPLNGPVLLPPSHRERAWWVSSSPRHSALPISGAESSTSFSSGARLANAFLESHAGISYKRVSYAMHRDQAWAAFPKAAPVLFSGPCSVIIPHQIPCRKCNSILMLALLIPRRSAQLPSRFSLRRTVRLYSNHDSCDPRLHAG
jgi:hypothetical protein